MNKKQRKQAKKAAESFLKAWRAKDFREMAKHSQITWCDEKASREGETAPIVTLEAFFGYKDLANYRITSSKIIGDCSLDVLVNIEYGAGGGKMLKKSLCMRVICEEAAYKPSLEGTWGVNPISVLKETGKR